MKTEQCKVGLTSKQKLKIKKECLLKNISYSIFLGNLVNQFFDKQTEREVYEMKLKKERRLQTSLGKSLQP